MCFVFRPYVDFDSGMFVSPEGMAIILSWRPGCKAINASLRSNAAAINIA